MTVCRPFRGIGREKNIGVGIDITDGCNMSCRHCYYHRQQVPLRHLPLEQLKKIISSAAEEFSELYLLGGEPTLHPELAQIVDYGLERMNMVMLVTNGLRLADEAFCTAIARPRFAISMHCRAIYSRHAALIDELQGYRGAFFSAQKAWRNIARHWRGRVHVQINLLKPLADNGCIMDVFKWARQNGYEPIVEMVKANDNFKRGSNLDLSPSEVRQIYQEMQDYDKAHYPERMPDIVMPPVYGQPCTLMESGVHITIDGQMILCVGNETVAYGNALTDSIAKIVDAPLRLAIQDYRNWIVGPCTQCPHFDVCHGGCRGNAKWETGCPRASNPYCWHHPKHLTLKDMVPNTCHGCILENHPGCGIKTRI